MHAHLDCHVVGEYGLWDGLKVKGWYFLSLPLLVADSEFQQQRSGLWNQFPLHLTAYKQVAVVKRLARGYCELPVSHCSPELPGLPAATDMPLNWKQAIVLITMIMVSEISSMGRGGMLGRIKDRFVSWLNHSRHGPEKNESPASATHVIAGHESQEPGLRRGGCQNLDAGDHVPFWETKTASVGKGL